MAKATLSLTQVLADPKIYRFPRIVAYNRLEARPRTTDFTRSLRAEVRDPLWMLTRQWQFGEFHGEDASSPLTARIAYQHYSPELVSLRGGKAFPFDPETMPLETRIEREPIPLTLRELASGEVFSDVLLAIRWGKQLLRMLTDAGLASHYSDYLMQFPIRVLPIQPANTGERRVEDAEAESIALVVAGRITDGVAVWRAVVQGRHDSWIDNQPGGDKPALKTLAKSFADAFTQSINRLFTQPESTADSAWLSNHLEYQFALGSTAADPEQAPVLRAEQYHEGHLDWYSFDAVTDRSLPRDPA
jgi:hypothetical protein